jgi:hypothetical protein
MYGDRSLAAADSREEAVQAGLQGHGAPSSRLSSICVNIDLPNLSNWPDIPA